MMLQQYNDVKYYRLIIRKFKNSVKSIPFTMNFEFKYVNPKHLFTIKYYLRLADDDDLFFFFFFFFYLNAKEGP